MARKKNTPVGKAYGGEKKQKELFLVVQGDDNNFYVAADAEQVPPKYNKNIQTYKPMKDDGVFQSPRAFVVTVQRTDNLERLLGGNLKGPPRPPK